MKKVKHSLKLIVCLLIAFSSTFAQTDEHEDCEVVITRADLERCAVYKRTNELLEREIKFKVVETVSLKDSCDKKQSILHDSIGILIQKNFDQKLVLATETKAKENNKTWALYMTIAFILSVLFLVLRSKIAKILPFLLAISLSSLAQDPMYRPPVSINGQKGLNQKIVFDTTSNKFSIVSANDLHTIGIPANTFQKVSPYIKSLNTGKDLAITLTRNHPTLIFAVKDSITFTLPSASDPLNKYVKYDIRYLGWRGGTGENKYMPFDSTYRMVFSDSIRYTSLANKTTYRTKVFDHLSAYNWFRLSPYRQITLEIISNKWYLTLNDFDY